MTEKKSLLARFDEETILGVITSPDDSERLFVSFPDNGKMITKSLSTAGGYSYPKMHLKVINNSAIATGFFEAYDQSEYGMTTIQLSVSPGETDEASIVYMHDAKENPWYYVNIGTVDGYVTATEMVNCRIGSANNILFIDDPSLDSSATVTIT